MLGRIDEPNAALAHATPYMQAFGHLVLGWIWLDLAICALSSATVDTRLRTSVLHTARWFIIHELPRIPAWLQPIERGDRTVHDTEEDWL
jgi:butyryl-CoA dehydrogenase